MVGEKKSVVVTQKFFDEATISYLEQHGFSVTVANFADGKTDASVTEAELISILSEADAWIVGHAKVTLSLLRSLPRLRVIARRGVGYEKVDLEAASATGKVVTIAAGGNEESVADRTLALMLAAAHRLRESQQQLIDGPGSILLGNDLYARTVGIVGLGRIARNVVRRLKAFDATVLVTTPRPDPDYGAAMGVEYVDLETLLRRSDFVSIHAPFKPETKHLIDAGRLALMESDSFLINTARGGLVDDQALLAALKSGRIAGAGLDVFESEADPDLAGVTRELVRLPNVVATPHSGASTHEGLRRTNAVAARCVISVLDGQEPPPGCLIVGDAGLRPANG
ncbi:D-isomer specific 2-hydroxyacid dehydrogenase NAD-binding protein [Alcanivorax balearicus MACL04]|uniref:D-isomer specific 2-hydroxyacid dehydrogenase NAD-binding protein n=1 Tax=Alloalcanivorax balearicus MACL04 TaxID=1177182 RepID=A0ABT2QY81_9GAMM|nr:phosphoglycerate dehydrogenase [Alloalcanivorax balearicus]MCU5782475.1 D-isomer specific 2-hydroxyacid dehydrogenase NAD-binding protein [Alloalcanivorax balearicus MACL04]